MKKEKKKPGRRKTRPPRETVSFMCDVKKHKDLIEIADARQTSVSDIINEILGEVLHEKPEN